MRNEPKSLLMFEAAAVKFLEKVRRGMASSRVTYSELALALDQLYREREEDDQADG